MMMSCKYSTVRTLGKFSVIRDSERIYLNIYKLIKSNGSSKILKSWLNSPLVFSVDTNKSVIQKMTFLSKYASRLEEFKENSN